MRKIGSSLAAGPEADDLLVGDTEALSVRGAEVDVPFGDDETLRLFDGAGRADYLEGGAAVELAGFAHGAAGNAKLELIAREDLALRFLAFGPEDPDALEGTLWAP